MSRIKTLSDEIDVSVSTAGLLQTGTAGYVYTKIYQDNIGIFSGLSYVVKDSSLIINLNDIASQNEYKKDYLKLQTNGELVTEPMILNMIGVYNVEYRFNRGAISNYRVTLDGSGNLNQSNVVVLCGYDYENKDLRPRCVQDLSEYAWDTSLCRLMTGCQWIWIPNEMGSFTNVPDSPDALPHYPFIYTNKYGIGLSLNHPGDDFTWQYCSTEFALHLTTGVDYNLGMTPFITSNTTFCTLNDFLSNIGTRDSIDIDSNSSIYLKQYGEVDDEFGDLDEEYTLYNGKVSISAIQVTGFKNDVWFDMGTFDEGDTFRAYLTRYINAAGADWNIDNIMSGDRVLYTTGWNTSSGEVNDLIEAYENQYEATEIPRSTTAELFYDKIVATPIYSEETDTVDVPELYHGKCIVGILDRCPARYYLAWNDRYGDMQSQPFAGKIVYSEDIQSEEIMNYKSRRRVSHKSIQPKWVLNTKWIDEDVYPIYESIFTSPYLLLYDAEQDKAWNVIVTDSKYEEKTRKNEKTLFNLELNVEANKTNELTY